MSDIVIGADEFSYFMYIYLVLSFVWFIVSTLTLWGRFLKCKIHPFYQLTLFSATIKDKKKKHYDGAILAWVVTASILSLLDLILLFILSHDYDIVESKVDEFGGLSVLAGVSK